MRQKVGTLMSRGKSVPNTSTRRNGCQWEARSATRRRRSSSTVRLPGCRDEASVHVVRFDHEGFVLLNCRSRPMPVCILSYDHHWQVMRHPRLYQLVTREPSSLQHQAP